MVAAFLLWGPIGLGNGPLSVGQASAESWNDRADAPVALSLPIWYAGHDLAVIDGLDIVGVTGYPGPHVISLEVLAVNPICSGLWPARRTGDGFVEAGCGGTVRGSLIGSSFASHYALSPGLTATAEFAAPRPGACWAVSKIAVHYHIGIRYFTATGSVAYAVCASKNPNLVQAAMYAAAGS